MTQESERAERFHDRPARTKKPKLGPHEWSCCACGKVHKKDTYCIAQQAMRHTIYFTCSCGLKQEVPE